MSGMSSHLSSQSCRLKHAISIKISNVAFLFPTKYIKSSVLWRRCFLSLMALVLITLRLSKWEYGVLHAFRQIGSVYPSLAWSKMGTVAYIFHDDARQNSCSTFTRHARRFSSLYQNYRCMGCMWFSLHFMRENTASITC